MKRPKLSDPDYQPGIFTDRTQRYISDLNKYIDHLEAEIEKYEEVMEDEEVPLFFMPEIHTDAKELSKQMLEKFNTVVEKFGDIEILKKNYLGTLEHIKNRIDMGDIEYGTCDFCKSQAPIQRTYLYPSNYVKPQITEEAVKLFNEGNYFKYISTCNDCGTPTTVRPESYAKPKNG